MSKTPILLILVVALGGGSAGLYLHQQNLQEQQRKAFEKEKEAMQREQERLNQITEQTQQELFDAQEAKRLAEAQSAKEAAKKAKLVSELNERLKIESDQREAAEKALDQLENEREKLALAQKDLEERLSKLESAAIVSSNQEESHQGQGDLADALEAQQVRMAQLAEENERLKQEYEAALEKQLKTAEAIVNAGGKPIIPNPTIRSLNDRRRNAVYLKERNLGTINTDRAEDSDK